MLGDGFLDRFPIERMRQALPRADIGERLPRTVPGRQGRPRTVAGKSMQAVSTGGLEYIDNHRYTVLFAANVNFQSGITFLTPYINGSFSRIIQTSKNKYWPLAGFSEVFILCSIPEIFWHGTERPDFWISGGELDAVITPYPAADPAFRLEAS